MNDQTLMLVIAVAIVAVIAIAAFMWSRRRRTEHLRERFGQEYDHAIEEKGDRTKAEAELAEREKRVEKLEIRPLQPAARQGFIDRWKEVQARFVDDPPRAVAFADEVIAEVMSTRGYPVEDFERRAGDISVNHPRVVEHYRAGHDIAVRHARGQASTEDLRQAMIHYRELFDALVAEPGGAEPQPEKTH
ncbi:MAG: hypothetical protein ACLGHC_05235 [Alphaproteobacteria bacterium]